MSSTWRSGDSRIRRCRRESPRLPLLSVDRLDVLRYDTLELALDAAGGGVELGDSDSCDKM